MNKRNDWEEFKKLLKQHNITKLYHFTDRDNLENIIKNGGLYSWKDCEERGIAIPKPGGGGAGSLSWSLDQQAGLEHYVRVSFTSNHPMMYVAMNEGRISNPVLLEIDPEVIYDKDTRYADRNATRSGARIGGTLDDFKRIHFQTVKAKKHFDLDADEQPSVEVYHQYRQLWHSYSESASADAEQERLYSTCRPRASYSIHLPCRPERVDETLNNFQWRGHDAI